MGSARAPSPNASVGMEEEFLLLDPKSGAPVPAAATILEQLRTTAPDWQGRLKPELAASQLEATTGICDTLSELRGQLRSGRRLLARAAREHQGLLAASGTPPGQTRFLPGDGARFERITDLYRGVVADYQTCGCHVHVGVADRSTAVEIINHLRPWLPTLLAISANSPFCNGADTGYASWRMVQQTRFPGAGVPPHFQSVQDYDAELGKLVDCGCLVDSRMTFWLARPSELFQTVEVRAADVPPTAGEAVLQAALVRGLVRAAITEIERGRPAPVISDQVAAAALWAAARYGLRGFAVDPWQAKRVPATEMVRALIRKITPALEDSNELAWVRSNLRWLLQHGTGADRQRRSARHGLAALTHYLAEQTCWEESEAARPVLSDATTDVQRTSP